ncbi:hypothetical protein [Rhizobium favelukesii]|uniref:hypothetical protein n=1 Tax=Rhizobium favelukesii TaxID=348824 RepID=UPI00216079D0|nr:hypothetical protein [Rhizobium favelukesii]MCS0459512.1 hypothetical protein [Rhizobium favelukesii]
MTFLEAYVTLGPDTIAISKALNIPEHEADRLINEAMERRHDKQVQYRRQIDARRLA